MNDAARDDDAGRGNDAVMSDLYDRYFTVVPADTTELLHAAQRLRYQVYCVEHAFEDPTHQVDQREVDIYDEHSVHAVLIYRPTGDVVGCVRLILPHGEMGFSRLPIRKLLNEGDRARLEQYDPARTAEISRYAVSKLFRRRQGEALYPDVDLNALDPQEARRLVPHVSLGLLRGVGRLAASHGVTTVCAAMAPALMRLLNRFGLNFEALGPMVDYHGLRQPCIADCESLLAGMATQRSDYYKVVDSAYRSR